MSKSNWGRPERTKSDQLIYRSKCGKFKIVRKTYVLPCASVAYLLTYNNGKALRTIDCDTLQDAKETALDLTEENGYTTLPLPEGV